MDKSNEDQIKSDDENKNKNSREFDLVIFGATGFAGFYILRELLISLEQDQDQYKDIKWAIAGRNLDKMNQALKEVGDELSSNGKIQSIMENIEKIQADISDQQSLVDMCKRTKLLINCVGPYSLMGRQVIDACLEGGCHHIDISGEPNYIESIVVDYFQSALEKNLIIISACGFDSIPCDLGVDFTKKKFPGKLHSIEVFVRIKPGPNGYKLNFGTLNSAIYANQHMNELKQIQRRLYTEIFSKKIPKTKVNLKKRIMPFKRDEINGWNVEFPGSDILVAQRSQHYNYQFLNEFPLQIQTYFTVPAFKQLFKLMIFGIMFITFTATRFGTYLLKSYPEFFTFGAFSKQGPNREQIESTNFELTFLGKGWSKKLIDELKNKKQTDKPDETKSEEEIEEELFKVKPDDQIIAKVYGADPGYIGTSTCIIQSALTILKETDKIPKGVLTPASAFRNTKIFDRLQKRGMKFEVLDLDSASSKSSLSSKSSKSE